MVRVVERHPPEQLPLEDVADEIRETLRRERAAALAAEAASAFTAALPIPLTPEFLGGAAPDTSNATNETAVAADDSTAASADVEAEAGAADAEAAGEEPRAASVDENENEADADMTAATDSPAARLAAEHGGTWHRPRWVQRSDISVPVEILAQAFSLGIPREGTHLQGSVELSNGGQALIVLSRVQPGDPSEVALDRRTALRDQLFEAMAGAELGAYAMSVREAANVDVPPQVLDPQF